jgi:hypothetical protein
MYSPFSAFLDMVVVVIGYRLLAWGEITMRISIIDNTEVNI